ncbi:hypothetical protein AeRB84_002754 [Aphanomyces euteiches]|nr:hypothetical protein AeRB84_002754 [Aphanomyces euteiches]
MLAFGGSHTAQEPTMAQEEIKTVDSQPQASDATKNNEDPIQQVPLDTKTCQEEDSANPIQQVAANTHTGEKKAIVMHSTSVEDSTSATKSILKRAREESDPAMTAKRHLTGSLSSQARFKIDLAAEVESSTLTETIAFFSPVCVFAATC